MGNVSPKLAKGGSRGLEVPDTFARPFVSAVFICQVPCPQDRSPCGRTLTIKSSLGEVLLRTWYSIELLMSGT